MTTFTLKFRQDGDYFVFAVGDRDAYRAYISRTAMGRRDPADGPTCEIHSTCLRDLTATGVALSVLSAFHVYPGVAADLRIEVSCQIGVPPPKVRDVIARLEAWPAKPSGLYYETQ